MERIDKQTGAAALEQLLSSATTKDLARSPQPSLSSPDLLEMVHLMGETKVNYANQSVPPGWAEQTRSHWTEIAARYGIRVLRDAVKAHMDVNDFLPSRSAINRQVEAVIERRRSEEDLDRTQRLFREEEANRERVRQERAAGVKDDPETTAIIARLNQRLDVIRARKQQEREAREQRLQERQNEAVQVTAADESLAA